ncbi:MAG: hypothetical protein SYC29_00860 [Planctomycetota bacterium]|nr:hypothetical protein [Planctomycetota bacterium]
MTGRRSSPRSRPLPSAARDPLIAVALLCLGACAPTSIDGGATPPRAGVDDEDAQLERAIDLIAQDRLDEAEMILLAVDAADENEWIVRFDEPARHFIAHDYLAVIDRRRAGDESDILFQSRRFRFHGRDLGLEPEQLERVKKTYETILDRVIEWADAEAWEDPDHRTIFVEILPPGERVPSPARTLIWFWDRQERGIRHEITARLLTSPFLEPVLAHELTHAVLPHTNRPLAEGVADLAMRELFPGVELPMRGRRPRYDEPWPLEEVLLFNWRAQGEYVKRAYAGMRADHLLESEDTLRYMLGTYHFGDALIALVDARWGRGALLAWYHATNRDPATFDMIAATEARLAPREELKSIWRAHHRQ